MDVILPNRRVLSSIRRKGIQIHQMSLPSELIIRKSFAWRKQLSASPPLLLFLAPRPQHVSARCCGTKRIRCCPGVAVLGASAVQTRFACPPSVWRGCGPWPRWVLCALCGYKQESPVPQARDRAFHSMAEEGGLEPPMVDPESTVLPITPFLSASEYGAIIIETANRVNPPLRAAAVPAALR